tara:strand:+ start:662 stop:2056 length:1395 start_codon:yes stop_codon:yes gene_type:complete
MLTNETRRNILDRVKASGYPGGVSEAFSAAEQGVDVVDQFVQQQQLEQQQQAEQSQGQQVAEGNPSPPPPPQNIPDGRVNPPNINNPIDNNQGHLVQAGDKQNVGIQSLPTGSAGGQIIQAKKGGVRNLYPHGGFHFNPADFDPNYDQGSVQDNTQINNFQDNQTNFEEKELQLAQIAKDKQYAETKAQRDAQKGTVFNTTKRNAGVALSNTMLTNQLAGGYGGSNMRKTIEAAPEKTEEIFKNTMRSSGMNTMRDVALGVTGVGASSKLATGTNNLGTRILSYPTNSLSKSIQSTITQPGIRNRVGSTLNSAYNYGLMTGIPDVLSNVTKAGINYSTGEQSGVGAFKDAALATANFVPAVKNFDKLGWVANNYGKVKNFAKGVNDFSKGDYLTGVTRQFGNSKNPIIKYGSKLSKNYIPSSYEAEIGVRSATGGQITSPGLNFKDGGVRYSRRKMGYVNKNIL